MVTCSKVSVPIFIHVPSSIRQIEERFRSRSRFFSTRCIGMMRSSFACHTSTPAGFSFGAGFASFASAAGAPSFVGFGGFLSHACTPKYRALPSFAHIRRRNVTTRVSAGKALAAAWS